MDCMATAPSRASLAELQQLSRQQQTQRAALEAKLASLKQAYEESLQSEMAPAKLAESHAPDLEVLQRAIEGAQKAMQASNEWTPCVNGKWLRPDQTVRIAKPPRSKCPETRQGSGEVGTIVQFIGRRTRDPRKLRVLVKLNGEEVLHKAEDIEVRADEAKVPPSPQDGWRRCTSGYELKVGQRCRVMKVPHSGKDYTVKTGLGIETTVVRFENGKHRNAYKTWVFIRLPDGREMNYLAADIEIQPNEFDELQMATTDQIDGWMRCTHPRQLRPGQAVRLRTDPVTGHQYPNAATRLGQRVVVVSIGPYERRAQHPHPVSVRFADGGMGTVYAEDVLILRQDWELARDGKATDAGYESLGVDSSSDSSNDDDEQSNDESDGERSGDRSGDEKGDEGSGLKSDASDGDETP